MSLQNLQAEFIDCIHSGDTNLPVYPPKNMQIYVNNIESSMVVALTYTYPMIQQILGHNFFTMAAKEYVYHYPSRSPDLHEYGEYFDSFISEFEPAKDFMYLSEVARFEWCCHQISFAAEHLSFNVEKLQTLKADDFERIHFILNPACRAERFIYPIIDIVDLCKNELGENVDLDKGGVNLLMARRDDEIKLQTLPDTEFVFLSHLQDNMPLSVALDEALSIDPNFDLDSMLAKLVHQHIIVDCQLIEN